LPDGSEQVIEVPEMIQVEVGMRVTIVVTGDGKATYRWGT
jgi:hypothetical protein